MARLENVKKNHFVSTLPKIINQKLVDNYRVKLFLKIKDSFERNKESLKNDELLFIKLLKNKCFINILKPINNSWFFPFIRA